MTPRGIAFAASLLAGAAGCTDGGRSPVGADLIPGGVLGGGLQVVTVRSLETATDYDVFASERGAAGILATAHEWPAAPGIESRGLVRFVVTDLDSLSEEREFLAASVRLVYTTPGTPVTLGIHLVETPWSDLAATWDRRDLGQPWSTPGGDFDPVPLAEFTVEPAEGDSAVMDSISVALPLPLVEGWITGGTPNEGLILVPQSPGGAVDFFSRESGVGARIDVDVRLPDVPDFVERVVVREDVFITRDLGALSGDGLRVGAGDPVVRAFLLPSLEEVPEGATVVAADLVLSVDRARIPGDSLGLVAREVVSEFRGEKTILARATSELGRDFLPADAAPDSVVLGSSLLTQLVRDWLRDPESNRGIVVAALGESTNFGGVLLFGPDAPAELRPRLRLILLPPPAVALGNRAGEGRSAP